MLTFFPGGPGGPGWPGGPSMKPDGKLGLPLTGVERPTSPLAPLEP